MAGAMFAMDEVHVNIFNIASYGYPDNNINDSGYGLINSVRSPPRQIQLSLHFAF